MLNENFQTPKKQASPSIRSTSLSPPALSVSPPLSVKLS